MASYLELKQQSEELLLRVEAARQQEIATAIGEIKERMVKLNLTLSDLREAGIDSGKPTTKPNEGPTPPKYRGPNGELWAGGRGRKPDWALEVIEKSGKPGLEKYRIKS